ncbi:hypothetical protein [Paracidovorax wautersii]|uniref:hypothetical protein n=1 Tax=Paracidovorax wautersii TaxID=1177982 RepID=UPI0031CDD7CC
MIFELTLGNVITVAALFVAALWALMKVISAQQEKRLGERFDGLHRTMSGFTEAQNRNAQSTLDLEREFRKHLAELPHMYVRHEDYVRGQSVIEAKLDGLATKVENAQLRGLINQGSRGQ